MAQYRAVIQGQRGAASRLGSKKSGLRATANAWDIGADAMLDHVKDDGRERDVLVLAITRGSHSGAPVATLRLNEDMLTDQNFVAKLRNAFDLLSVGV